MIRKALIIIVLVAIWFNIQHVWIWTSQKKQAGGHCGANFSHFSEYKANGKWSTFEILEEF